MDSKSEKRKDGLAIVFVLVNVPKVGGTQSRLLGTTVVSVAYNVVVSDAGGR